MSDIFQILMIVNVGIFSVLLYRVQWYGARQRQLDELIEVNKNLYEQIHQNHADVLENKAKSEAYFEEFNKWISQKVEMCVKLQSDFDQRQKAEQGEHQNDPQKI